MASGAAFGWGWLTDLLEDYGFEAHLVHPLFQFRQESADHRRGRLASLGLGGLTADALGIQAVYLLGGVLLLLAGTTGLIGLRRQRPLEVT